MNNNSGIPYNNAGNQQYTGQQGIDNSQIPQNTDTGYQNNGANYGQQGTGYQNTGANQGQQVGQDQNQIPQSFDKK